MKPLLIYDGDCAFCRMWIGYWRTLTGDGIDYEPYQTAAERFPQVPVENFRRAAHLVLPGGEVFRAALAVFHTLGGWPLWAYRQAPGFAPLTEWAYRLIAAHRNFGYRVTVALWGRSPQPPTYEFPAWLFLKLLGLIYVIAFVSFAVQARGLIGAQGILPLGDYLATLRQSLGALAYWQVPSVLWLAPSDIAVQAVCWAGAVLALAVIAGRFVRPALAILYVLYLSLCAAGQEFMSYQWDVLLVETGFLAIFLAPSRLPVWLLRWLLFKLVFQSGAIKLLSGDPSWRNLTALAYHYETQPLPTPLAWYFHQAPPWFRAASLLFVFVVELAAPFLIFAPRRLRFAAGGLIATLQVLILLTGNYTFFNLLTIALCVLLLDDQAFRRRRPLPAPATWRMQVFAAIIIGLGLFTFTETFRGTPGPLAWLAPLRTINSYGLFAVMTTTRPEIVVEGSEDGEQWLEYEFRYKPGDLDRAPPWVAPHQPRLDWQMWFAALGSYRDNPWFVSFMVRLLQASPPVLRLLERDPFHGSPPRYIRARLYEYRFTRAGERGWWRRQSRGLYFPPVSLR